MQGIDSIFFVIILIMSVVLHEVSHGYAALYFGDKTAKYQGRLTLNPIKHLDLFGSVLIPLLLIISKAGFIFGWAKPVPYNPANLRNRRIAEIWVASAGIISNILISIFFSLFTRIFLFLGILNEKIFSLFSTIVLINLVLAFFNLIPVPPLDGSKIFFGLMPQSWFRFRRFMEEYSFFVLLFVIFFLSKFIQPVVFHIFSLLMPF